MSLPNQAFNYQLYESDKNISNNHSLETQLCYFGQNIDIPKLSCYSGKLKKKIDAMTKKTKGNSIESIIKEFQKELEEAFKSLYIDDNNYSIFINLIAGKSQNLKIESFFDIFKLSKHFEIKTLLQFLQKTCKQINDTQTIHLILHKGEIGKNEEKSFLDFLECGGMDQKLSERIQECFKKSFFNDFPVSAIFKIFKRCNNKELIPPNDLYQFIIKSIETKLSLLPFLDIYHLSYGNKQSVFKFVSKMEDETNQIKTENEELKRMQQPGLQNNEMNRKMNEFKTNIKSVETENEKLNQNMNELKKKVRSLEIENEKLKRNEQSNIQTDKLNQNMNELKTKIRSLEVENEKLKRNEQSNIQTDKLNQNMNELKTKIRLLETENDKLKRNEQSNIQIDKLNQNMNALKSKIRSLETENEKLKRNEKISLQNSELNHKISDLETKTRSLTIENDKLKRNEQSNFQIDKLQTKIRSLEVKNEQNNLQIDKLKTRIESLETENEKLKRNEQSILQVEELNQKLKELKIKIKSLETENLNLKSQNKRGKEQKRIITSSESSDEMNDSKDYQLKTPKHAPHLSSINFKRIQIFNENKSIVSKGFYQLFNKSFNIKKDLEYSINQTRTFQSDYKLTIESNKKHFGKQERNSIYSKIEITKESTFAAAIRMKKKYSKKVCVLNFASATQPGGGVLNGRNAQEESLARQSTLYFSLVEQTDFYEYNKENYNPFGNDNMIYSPNVIIIRDDYDKLIEPVKVSIISAVAVNCSELNQAKNQNQKVYEIMKNRCRRILELCINRGNDVIVLGAFGCGVFENSPKMISQIFKELLIDDFYGMEFIKIIFAIKTKPNQSNEMIDDFENALSK